MRAFALHHGKAIAMLTDDRVRIVTRNAALKASVKRLKEAGVDETQAEALVETFGGVFNDHIATKDDLEQRMTIKLGGMLIVAVGVLVLLDRLFPVVAGG